ncbi:MAG TPA: hypothetical protein VIW01_10635 [Dehalococcoidia bacterium]
MLNKILLVLAAPLAVPGAIVLGLVLAPAAAFFWLTFLRVGKVDSAFVAWVYALLAASVVGASIAWPILAIYGANQL